MAKLTEYPQATAFDNGDILIKDGVNGTKKILASDAAKFMSSDAKEQIKKLSGKSRFDTVHQEEMSFVILGGLTGTGKWAEHTTATSSVVRIPEWAVSVEMTYEKSTQAYVAFLNTFTDPEDGATPDYSDGFNNRVPVPAGEVVKYDIADDMHYLYWQQKGTTGVYMRPTVYFIGNVTEELVEKGAKEAAALSYTEKRAASYEFVDGYYTGNVNGSIGGASSESYIRTRYRLPLNAKSRISLGKSTAYTMQVFNTVRGGNTIKAKHGWSSEDVFVDPDDFDGGCTAAVSFGRIDGEPLTNDDKAAIEAAFDIYYISGYKLTTPKTLTLGLELGNLSPTEKKLYDSSDYNSDHFQKMRTPCFLDVSRCSGYMVTSSFYSITALYYDKDYVYITDSGTAVTPNTVYDLDDKACYIRFVVANENDAEFDHYQDFISVVCSGDAKVVKCIAETGTIRTQYTVPGQIGRDHDGNTPQIPPVLNTTVGLLRLPPNYDNEGEPVPLIVYAHGSSDYSRKWQIRIRQEVETTEVIDYLSNEGYAVFDCFGHTDEAEAAEGRGHTYGNADCMNCYIAGIRRCMEIYNLRTDGIYVTGISSGGLTALNLAFNNTIPVLACAPLAPAVDPYGRFLEYTEERRKEYAWAMGFTEDTNNVLAGRGGESPTANSEPAYTNDLIAYYTENASKMIGYNPMWNGVINKPLSTLLGWSLEPRDTDKTRLAGGSNDPTNWADTVRVCKSPIKIWIADDDANVPPGVIYNFITSLKNGNCIAEKRQVPNGTGRHYAFTSSPDTIKQSGKTALGIAYTDIPIYWPEMVAFFRRF